MGNIFVGFSTIDTARTGNSTYYDIELIKQDLYFAFNTRVGERVMRPDWGCKIWDYFMEPGTAVLYDLIVAEATRICEEDSRVSITSLQVFQLDQGIRVEILLNYSPFNVVDTFVVNFENRQSAYIQGPQ